MKRQSLYAIVFGIFSILVVLNCISIYFSINQHRKEFLDTAIAEKTNLAEMINELTNDSVVSYRLSFIPAIEKSLVDNLSKFKDVLYVRIVTADGQIYQTSHEKEWGEKINDSDIAKALTTKKSVVKDGVFQDEKIKIIIYPGYQDRTVWVGFSLKGIEELIRSIFWRDIALAAEGLLSLIFMMILVLVNIIRPIKKMTSACEEVRKGNLGIEIKTKSKNEIGELADAFNKMIVDLKDSQSALEEAKTVLELKVGARTKELKDLADSLEGQVKERTKELQAKIEELERFQKIAVGRELKMVELKSEIKKLEKRLK